MLLRGSLYHLITLVMIEDFKILPVPKHLAHFVKPFDEWNWTHHGHYWRIRDMFYELDKFIEVLKCYPIEDMNNADSADDPNPFAQTSIPYWIFAPIAEQIRNFIIVNHFKQDVSFSLPNERLSEWGNVYSKKHSRPVGCWQMPHRDFATDEGFIGNLWLSHHEPNETGTAFFDYKGTIDEGRYDFQIDPNHHRYKEWHSWHGSGADHDDRWINFDKRKQLHWGFNQRAVAPAEFGTMTLYDANAIHAPYIPDSVEWRWSHCFGFKYTPLRNVLR